MKRDEPELTMFAGLIVILEDWAAWNAQYSGMRQSSGAAGINGAGKSFGDLLDEAVDSVMKIVETSIDDLPPAQRGAINRRYGICAVFRFPRDNYSEMLLAAHEALLRVLPRKGVVI